MESPFDIQSCPQPVTSRHAVVSVPRCLRYRAPVLWLLLPFAAGLILARCVDGLPSPLWLHAAAIAALLLALQLHKRPNAWWACLFALALMLTGAAYYGQRRARLETWDRLPAREARLVLRVDRTFTPAPDGKRLSGLGTIVQSDQHLHELIGQHLYFALAQKPGAHPPVRSSHITVIGLLQPLPRHPPADTFDGYLANLGMNFRINRGRMLSISKPPTLYRNFCDKALGHLSDILGTGLDRHPELCAISRAMLLGLQQELNEEQTRWFMRSGTMHLFSISGLHIAVIALSIEGLLGLLRLPRIPRFILGAVLLWLYVDITGTAPSAVRAYVMVLMVQASYVLRLPVNPVAALGFAAMGALLLDPMQLFTASFQMSYGIVAILVMLGLPLGVFWTERWQPYRLLPKVTWTWWQRMLDWARRQLLGMLAIGLATALVSTLCGVIYFKLLTPGSLVANLVLIPAGSLAIVSGFSSLVCGLAGLSWLSSLFNHASALLLLGCERGIDTFLKVPGVFHPATFRSNAWGFTALGLLLTAVFWGYATRWERKRGGIWPPFIIVALSLLIGLTPK